MPRLGNHKITIVIPEQTITIDTEFMEHDFDETDDPKVAALKVLRDDNLWEIGEKLDMKVVKVDAL